METVLYLTAILAANSLFIWGLNACFDSGMIFNPLDRWANRTKKRDELTKVYRNVRMNYQQRAGVGMVANLVDAQKQIEPVDNSKWEAAQRELEALKPRLPEWLQKPLYSCPICMASIWGTIGFWLGLLTSGLISWQMLIVWPVYCICLAGLNAIIYNLFPCDD